MDDGSQSRLNALTRKSWRRKNMRNEAETGSALMKPDRAATSVQAAWRGRYRGVDFSSCTNFFCHSNFFCICFFIIFMSYLLAALRCRRSRKSQKRRFLAAIEIQRVIRGKIARIAYERNQRRIFALKAAEKQRLERLR